MHTELPVTLGGNEHGAKSLTGSAAAPNGVMFRIAQEFRNLVKDIEDLAQSTSSLNDEELARTKAKLHARVASAKDSIQRISNPLVDDAGSTIKGADSDLNVRPWKAIGVAAGVSLIIGYLLGRSRAGLDPQGL